MKVCLLVCVRVGVFRAYSFTYYSEDGPLHSLVEWYLRRWKEGHVVGRLPSNLSEIFSTSPAYSYVPVTLGFPI